MRFSTVLLTLTLFYQVLSQGTSVEERKLNMVVNILNRILRDMSELFTKDITIPLVDLGDFGSFNNVTLSLPKITNKTDGVGQFGFELHMNLSEITATGTYDVQDVDLPGLFPISGEGNFLVSVEAVNLKVKLKAAMNFETDKFDFDFDTFNIQVVESKLNFENLMYDPYVSDFLNELIGNLVPSLVKALEPLILSLTLPLVDYYGNGIIKCIKTELGDLENCIKRLFEIVVDDTLRRLA